MAVVGSKYRPRGCSLFAGWYLLVPETREIEGTPSMYRDLAISNPLNIHSPLLLFLPLLCTIWLTYTKGETKLRIKSPDACNAFFIKVSELYGAKCVTHIIYTRIMRHVCIPPLYARVTLIFPRFHGVSWIFTAFFPIVCTRVISFPFLFSVAGKLQLQSLRGISQIFRFESRYDWFFGLIVSNNIINLCEFMPFRRNRVFEFLKMDVGFETLFLSFFFFWSEGELKKDIFYIRFKYYSRNHDRVFEFLKMDVGFETLFLPFFWSGEELEKDTFYIRFKYYSEVSCRFTLI